MTAPPVICRWCGGPVEAGKKGHGACLPKRLAPALRALEKDLLVRAKTERVEAGLKQAWEDEQKAGQTGQGFEPWRRERVTQLAVAWILSIVFIRTLEDRGYIDPRLAGATAAALRAAEAREQDFRLEIATFAGPREYLLAVFRELARLPGARDVFDTRHNPIWALSPSSAGAQALLEFFRKQDDQGAPALVFTGADTRFLGDLYQDLSEAVRKRYALLQTPDFVEEFILDQTLDPAIAEFGLKEVTLIDPTCGSGHFLLGAFKRLLGRRQEASPGEHVADLARQVLGQVYGVDINPYAVAIARFRIVLAVLDSVGIKRLERAPDIRPNVVVADSLLHRFDQRADAKGQMSLGDDLQWGERLFRLDNRAEVERVLSKRFHAVVGNPPYITEKDRLKRKKYRDMYESAAGKYALSAPFTERFFELAVVDGFVGLINSNAWTKRDYGKRLIEAVLPRLDVQKVIDTSGCYLPGHGTPTLLLFGRNRKPAAGDVTAVFGKRGEQSVPVDPAHAPVWTELAKHHATVGFEGAHVTVESLSRAVLSRSPWILVGGGARQTMATMQACAMSLGQLGTIGVFGMTNANDCYLLPVGVAVRRRIEPSLTAPFYSGQTFRDWLAESEQEAIFPYGDSGLLDIHAHAGLHRFLWAFRTVLGTRATFDGGTYFSEGIPWWKWHQVAIDRVGGTTISFSYVSTHNQFWLGRGRNTFNQPAPLIKLRPDCGDSDHQAIVGYLNSSIVGFWCRLVMFPKGVVQAGETMTIRKAPWISYLEYAGNLLQQLPVPALDGLRDKLLDLVIAAEDVVKEIGSHAAEAVAGATLAATPTRAALRDARSRSFAERARLRGILVSLQEEMDWRVYGLFGLPTIEAPSVEAVRVPVEPNHRPFEVRLARDVTTDISAREWFRVHEREAPQDVGGPLADLYQQRLRLLDHPLHGKQLRLLETPEAKRRWSPPDDARAFSDAVRTWLLERIEAAFRAQATPELRTARQLALELGRDPAVAAAHELLTEDSGLDLVGLLSSLVDAEGVPFLAGYRYSETAMTDKRPSWEEAWRLQRLEDEGRLEPELKRLGLKAIPEPDKYGPKDFLRHYWSLRGKLDVPKERFITVPGGNTDDDSTPLVGWAGWDHAQVARALGALYQQRKDEWPLTSPASKDRLVPLLAGLAERVPWLLQWHNEPTAAFAGKLGDFFRDYVSEEALALGVAASDLRTWTPPAAARRAAVNPDEVLAALAAWKPEADDDEAEADDEPPAGPTEADLATEVGVTRALIKKALKQLEADGLVEKLAGRPARYVATGDLA